MGTSPSGRVELIYKLWSWNHRGAGAFELSSRGHINTARKERRMKSLSIKYFQVK